MPNNSSSVLLDVTAGEEPQVLPVEVEPGDLFRILILGDFGGRAERDDDLASRKPQPIDRDRFDDVLRAANVRVSSGAVKLKFIELEDFTPDAIFERCELFRGAPPIAQASSAPVSSGSSVESDLARLTSGSLLDQVVEQSAGGDGDDLQGIVNRVVAPHLVRHEDRSAEHEEHARAMRAILHDPQFQALEAAWRSLDMLARGLDTDGALSLHILDVTKAELARSLDALDFGDKPWALMIGNYSFDCSAEDAKLLERLGALARRTGAPFIAEAAPPDDDSETAEWRALRRSPGARWIGLALPRFLVRMPYGRQSYAIDSFPFEEIPGRPEHGDYLWGNPAFICAWLLGRAFNEQGWRFRPGAVRRIDGLPYHVCQIEGETRSQPCAEVALTDHEIEFIQDHGFMALAAMKNSDVAMIMRFQSIAEPPAGLAGRWE